jgi:hypothetical protein
VVVICVRIPRWRLHAVNIQEKQEPGKCGVGGDCLGNFELGGEVRRFSSTFGRGAESQGACPGDAALGDALDNEVDGRYEPPPIEDARWRPPFGHADLNAR